MAVAVKPAGNASVTVTAPTVGAVPILLTVMVYVAPTVWPCVKLPACVLVMVTSGISTVTEADAVPPVPPSVEVTLPVVLFFTPPVVPVTFTLKVHEVLAAVLAPVRLTKPEAAAPVIVPPPHEPVSPFGVETTRPVGSVSAKPTPVSVVVVLLF